MWSSYSSGSSWEAKPLAWNEACDFNSVHWYTRLWRHLWFCGGDDGCLSFVLSSWEDSGFVSMQNNWFIAGSYLWVHVCACTHVHACMWTSEVNINAFHSDSLHFIFRQWAWACSLLIGQSGWPVGIWVRARVTNVSHVPGLFVNYTIPGVGVGDPRLESYTHVAGTLLTG